MISFRLLVLIGAFSAAGLISAQAGASGYSLLDLGNVTPTALNNLGQVVGVYGYYAGVGAFVTGNNGNGFTSLGFLGSNAVPTGINDSGEIIGSTFLAGQKVGSNTAFMATADGTYTLQSNTTAYGINASGQVVGVKTNGSVFDSGSVYVTGPHGQGIVYTSTNIGSPVGINNSGQIAGESFPTLTYQGVYVTGKAEQGLTTFSVANDNPFNPFENPALGEVDVTSAVAINNVGQVLAEHTGALGLQSAYISSVDGSGLVGLGEAVSTNYFISSNAKGFNDLGQVVGSGNINIGNNIYETHAFVTGNDGNDMVDLNSLVSLGGGDYFSGAEGINNVGQMIAEDKLGIGYLLTPLALQTSPAPEPGNALLLALGIASVGFAMRRRAV